MVFIAPLVANVGAARSSLSGLSLASKESVLLPLLPFVEFSNAMKSSLMECRPLDRLNASCLDPMSSSFQFCMACVSPEMRTGSPLGSARCDGRPDLIVSSPMGRLPRIP
jgi:hypothetical protein